MKWVVWFSVASAIAVSLAQAFKYKRKAVQLEQALQLAQKQRSEERTGRIRAQRDLRKNLMHSSSSSSDGNSSSPSAFPMTPIGYIRSCYSTRNGTPRQPQLVTLAKSCLILSTGVPSAAFEGLDQYSHCWLIYVFHENTDLHNLWELTSHRDFKAKVRVPRLDGDKLGVFATRTPHRPCPIGLTVAKIERLDKGVLFLSGADLVDGTPVLDIKPYLPYCDSVREACAPLWVKAGGEDDPLALASVKFSEASLGDFSKCWEEMGKYSLYVSVEEFQSFVAQVLSRDIRSLNQRQRPHNGVVSDVTRPVYGTPPGETCPASRGDNEESIVLYHVVLEGVRISYTLDTEGNVLVRSATVSNSLKNPLISTWSSKPA